jgi:hypothetical protein
MTTTHLSLLPSLPPSHPLFFPLPLSFRVNLFIYLSFYKRGLCSLGVARATYYLKLYRFLITIHIRRSHSPCGARPAARQALRRNRIICRHSKWLAQGIINVPPERRDANSSLLYCIMYQLATLLRYTDLQQGNNKPGLFSPVVLQRPTILSHSACVQRVHRAVLYIRGIISLRATKCDPAQGDYSGSGLPNGKR